MAYSLTDFIRITDNEFASIADDGIIAGDVSGWIDSGSYVFNALLSGSIYGGFPKNKIVMIGSPNSTGKTFFALAAAKNFLQEHPTGIVICFETESATTKKMLVDRGIDTKRFGIIPVNTVQQFKIQLLKIINNYEKDKVKDRVPLLLILDSLGMLSTTKEMEDADGGKETKDMTRAGQIKSAFRVLTLKLGRANVPLVVTNHVYADVMGGIYASAIQGGGCLVAGTQIIMKNNELKCIEDVQIGDTVLTHNGTFEEVTNTFVFNDKEIYQIEFEDGSIVKCSGDHKFMVNGLWVEAKNLEVSEDCMLV